MAPTAHAGKSGLVAIAILLLNGGLVLGGAAEIRSLQARLERLTSSTRQHALATERTEQGLTTLRAQARTLADGLFQVSRSVASSAHEDALFLKVLILKPGIDHALARRIAVAVQRECSLVGQDPNLVLSVMAIESGFNPQAVSSEGAVGLMQVMPLWKKALGVKELSDPEVSIRAGTQILTRYQEKYRDLELAVTAYNRGPTAVSQALESGERPTNGYSAKVLGLWQRLRAIDLATRQTASWRGPS